MPCKAMAHSPKSNTEAYFQMTKKFEENTIGLFEGS